MNFKDLFNPDIKVPGTPTEKWGYDPERRCGYLRMTDDDYGDFPAVNASLVKCATLNEMYCLLTSPRQRNTEALAVGTLADMAILTPEVPLSTRFVAAEIPVNPTTGKCYGLDSKKAEDAMARTSLANPGKFVVSADLFDDYERQLKEIGHAFFSHALCSAALKDAMLQVTGIMWDEQFGCWVKWKPDVLPLRPDEIAGWTIKDLKTSRRHVLGFEKDCHEFGYFVQGFWYKRRHEKCMAKLGLPLHVANFDFLVVSKSDRQPNKEGNFPRRPRRAMARFVRVPVEPSLNLHLKSAEAALEPKDGMGRVEMFVAAAQEHMRVNPEPDDEAAISKIWTAFEDQSEPFELVWKPRDQ